MGHERTSTVSLTDRSGWQRWLALALVVAVIPGALCALRARRLYVAKKELRRELGIHAELELAAPRPVVVAPDRDGTPALRAALGQLTLDDTERIALRAFLKRGDDLDLPGERLVELARRNAQSLDLASETLGGIHEWSWPEAADGLVPRTLLHAYGDLAALLGVRALAELAERGDVARGWKALSCALEVERAMALACTPAEIGLRSDIATGTSECAAAMLRRGRAPDPATARELRRAFVQGDLDLERCHATELARMVVEVKTFLEDGSGRLCDDYVAQGGSTVELWLRRGLASRALVEGLSLERLALQCAQLTPPADQLARTIELEDAWRGWLRASRVHLLYRITPLSLLERHWAHRRTRGALAVAVALATYRAQHGRWPDGLPALVGEHLDRLAPDPLTGQLPLYTRAGPDAEVRLVPDPRLPELRRRWQVGG